MARLDRLGPTRELAQLASVFGREFVYEWLREVTQEEEAALRSGLERLVEAGLVYRQRCAPREVFAFKHALVQEAAYRSLLSTRRRGFHRRIAEVLVERFPELREEAPEVIAHHYAESDKGAAAIPYWREAARLAMARAANREAVTHARRGLQAVEAMAPGAARDEAERELRLAEAEAQNRDGMPNDAMAAFERAAELAGSERSGALVEAVVGFESAEFQRGGPEQRSVPLLERTLERTAGAGPAERARVMAGLARALSSIGVRERASELIREAAALARRSGEPEALCDVLNLTGYLWGNPGQQANRRRASEELIRLAEELGDLDRLQRAYAWRACDAFECGDVSLARTTLEAYESIIAESRQPTHAWVGRSLRCVEALVEGRFDDAERLAHEAAALARRVQGLDAAGQLGVQMFTIRREQGRLASIAPFIEQVLARASDVGVWQPGLAVLYADLDRRGEAAAVFERLARRDFALPYDATRPVSLAYLAEVCAYLGDTERAARLYEALAPHSGYSIMMGIAVVCYGAADRFLGQLAWTLGDPRTAERHFERALGLNESMGARPWLAHTRHRFAQMLLARGRSGDSARAVQLLGEALAAADALGMEGLRARIRATQCDIPAMTGEHDTKQA